MEVIKDKPATVKKAQEIGHALIEKLNELIKDYDEEDPAERIYLLSHIAANFGAMLTTSIVGFGKVFAVPNLSVTKVREFIDSATDEYLRYLAKQMDEVIKDYKGSN